MTPFDTAVETLRRMLTELEKSGESGVVGVDIVVKRGQAQSVNRKVQCQGEISTVSETPVVSRTRFKV